jgi:hypothetical protein
MGDPGTHLNSNGRSWQARIFQWAILEGTYFPMGDPASHLNSNAPYHFEGKKCLPNY